MDMQMNPGKMQELIVEKQMQSGANWFYTIAGFSLINTIITLAHLRVQFIVGLGVTELADVYGRASGGVGFALGIDIIIALVFVAFGFSARKGQAWAFWVGMILYLLDGGLLFLIKDYITMAFHVYALWRIFQGFQASQQWQTLAAQNRRNSMETPTQGVWPPPPTSL